MKKHSFSATDRYAVYVIHGEKCYLCGKPVAYSEVEIDHVVPESLEADPAKLGEVRAKLGLADSFNVNAYENWMPACGPCNTKKREHVFEPSGWFQLVLERAQAKATKVREFADNLVSDKRIGRAIAIIEAAHQQGILPDAARDSLRPLLELHITHRAPAQTGAPIRLTPLYEVLNDNGSVQVVKGPFGVGGGPSGQTARGGECGVCGFNYWNGARCVICGNLADD